MRIALAQLNYRNGDVQGNTDKIITAIQKARTAKAELIIFPELSVCGPMPGDLLEKEDFINECRLAVERIAMHCEHMAAIVGAPNLDTESGIMYNSAYFIDNGEVVDGVHKTILSDYDIFNESRYFVAGEENTAIQYKNQKIRIIFDEYEADWIDKQDNFVVYIGQVPFTTESRSYREQVLANLSQKYRKDIFAVNHVGGYTAILYDGNSMVYNFQGQQIALLKDFEEDFQLAETGKSAQKSYQNKTPDRIAMIHKALVSGIRDYFRKNGFKTAVLGLSGGIDSAVVAALTAEALGAEQVCGLLMPSVFSTDHSIKDAQNLAQNLNIAHTILPIGDLYDQYLKTLHPLFGELPFNVAEENLQARIRGALVMATSNKFGHIALNTSNKSEAAVGYGTLYGDMCGSLSVIGDVYKTDVFKLARYINREKTVIPENTIIKAPSAELHPDQKDQDSLPPYDVLDTILRYYIEDNLSAESIIAKGCKKECVERIIRMVKQNEYKRAQCPPILRISSKAFGEGRKFPF